MVPGPARSFQLTPLALRVKRSSTLLPNVVRPVIVHLAGDPSSPKMIFSAMVGPRPFCLILKSTDSYTRALTIDNIMANIGVLGDHPIFDWFGTKG
jgi:hypothetical protein